MLRSCSGHHPHVSNAKLLRQAKKLHAKANKHHAKALKASKAANDLLERFIQAKGGNRLELDQILGIDGDKENGHGNHPSVQDKRWKVSNSHTEQLLCLAEESRQPMPPA